MLYFLLLLFALKIFAAPVDEMRALYQKAEACMHQKRYEEARVIFSDLLKMPSTQLLDPYTYCDLVIRLSSVENRVGMQKEAERRLKALFQKPLPDDLNMKARVVLARIKHDLGSSEEAWLILQELKQKVPEEGWPEEEALFLVSIKQILKERFQGLMGHAKRLFDAALFVESAHLCQEILEHVRKGHFPFSEKEALGLEVTFQLARAHFEADNTTKVTALLQPLWLEWKKKDAKNFAKEERKILFLLARAYKKLGNYQEQIQVLQAFLHSQDLKNVPQLEEALFELGNAHLKLGEMVRAKECFQKVLQEGTHSKTLQLARIYLSRVHLKEKTPSAVEPLLDPLAASLNPSDPLKYEVSYLQGEAAFQKKEFAKAAHFFELAIPRQNKERALWTENALYTLGWSFLKLAEDPKEKAEVKKEMTNRAEKAFREVMKKPGMEEKGLLALARVLQMKGSQDDLEELEELLGEQEFFSTLENQATALLIRADAQKNPEVKSALYKQLTEAIPFCTTNAGKRGWYFRAMSHYVLAEEGKGSFKRSGELFMTAYDELLASDRPMAFLALLYAGKSFYFAADERAGEVFDTLVRGELFEEGLRKEEALYFHVLCLKVESSVEMLHERFPQSPYTARALFFIATNYFENEVYDRALFFFSILAEKYRDFVPESLFWAAEAAEKGEGNEEVAQAYRRRLFEEYPDAPLAAEAYFRLYTFAEYLSGEEQQVAHLKQMKEVYPHSPFLMIATYLLAQHAKDPLLYGEAIRLYEPKKIPEAHLQYFTEVYYRARLEEASLYLAHLEDPEALLSKLKAISADFAEEGTYVRFCEESDWLIAKAFLKMGKREEAKEQLQKNWQKYAALGITRGYFLGENVAELGALYLEEGDAEKALEHLKLAEASSDFFSLEQRLDLWMHESAALKALQRFDEAMLMLSHVINENASSSLRVQAMLQRADLYALQGRHELAIKQLEAVAKKGGDFAHIALDRLRSEYGF